MNKKQLNERRNFKRLRAYHLAKYKLLTNPSVGIAAILTSVKDISGGGARLRTKEEIPVSSFIQLFINFPQLPDPISCVAKAVWAKVLNDNNYEIGLEFVEIGDLLREEIIRRINYVIKKTEK